MRRLYRRHLDVGHQSYPCAAHTFLSPQFGLGDASTSFSAVPRIQYGFDSSDNTLDIEGERLHATRVLSSSHLGLNVEKHMRRPTVRMKAAAA